MARREFVIDVEGGFAPAAMRRLREMGYNLNVISLEGEPRMGYGAAISLGKGTVTAGADPRRSGTAGAIPDYCGTAPGLAERRRSVTPPLVVVDAHQRAALAELRR